MPSTCEFKLNKPNGVYHSGDTISGAIVLNTTSPKDVREVSIIFRGEGKVSWHKSKGRGRKVHYKSKELYIDNSTTVHGDGILPAGEHTYNFQIVLPQECSTSCEGRYGHIRYEITLKLDRPFHIDNLFNKVLTVIKPQDLNFNPALRFPIETDEIFNSCFWWCSNGNINVKLQIPFGGYAIGQSAKYSVHVQNQSMIDVFGYTIEFIRKITFTAHEPKRKTRDEEKILHENSYNANCLRLTSRVFDGTFPIGGTIPPTVDQSIIYVQYLLKVTLNMEGCNKDKSISIPIFIGTIPMGENVVSSENDPLIAPTAPTLTLDVQESSDLPPSYNDLGPPSYEKD